MEEIFWKKRYKDNIGKSNPKSTDYQRLTILTYLNPTKDCYSFYFYFILLFTFFIYQLGNTEGDLGKKLAIFC
jgi:hypothetical protein